MYFGKGCKHLIGQWDDVHESGAPAICWCNHKQNPNDVEGNCNKSDCPLKVCLYCNSRFEPIKDEKLCQDCFRVRL